MIFICVPICVICGSNPRLPPSPVILLRASGILPSPPGIWNPLESGIPRAGPHHADPEPSIATESRGVPIDAEATRRWLAGLGVRDPERGRRDLADLEARASSPTVAAVLIGQLATMLPDCPDPGMALTNLERFVAAAPDGVEATDALATSPRTTEILVQLFSTSQYFSELLIRDPAAIHWLRGGADRRDRQTLIDDLWAEVRFERAGDEAVRLAIRRFRHREMLRVGYNDIVRGLPLEITTLDLSHLADACIEAACRVARRNAVERHGEPIGRDGKPARFVVLALGKLGGEELNYSSDIDLIFLYDEEGRTDGPRARRRTPSSSPGWAARSSGCSPTTPSRASPTGSTCGSGPKATRGRSRGRSPRRFGYYETSGRTWERQALIKCRPVAGRPGARRRASSTAITPVRLSGATSRGPRSPRSRR